MSQPMVMQFSDELKWDLDVAVINQAEMIKVYAVVSEMCFANIGETVAGVHGGVRNTLRDKLKIKRRKFISTTVMEEVRTNSRRRWLV